MTYGAQLQNELGETITEYEDVLYEIDTFQTITPPTYQYSYGFDHAYFQGWVNTVSSPGDAALRAGRAQWAHGGFRLVERRA